MYQHAVTVVAHVAPEAEIVRQAPYGRTETHALHQATDPNLFTAHAAAPPGAASLRRIKALSEEPGHFLATAFRALLHRRQRLEPYTARRSAHVRRKAL